MWNLFRGNEKKNRSGSWTFTLPQVLILDEPTVGLDIESRNIIWKLLKDLRNNGMTIILSSHYLDEIDKLADRLVIIDDGRVIAQGAPAELKIN